MGVIYCKEKNSFIRTSEDRKPRPEEGGGPQKGTSTIKWTVERYGGYWYESFSDYKGCRELPVGWMSLLEPRWKGRVAFVDPLRSDMTDWINSPDPVKRDGTPGLEDKKEDGIPAAPVLRFHSEKKSKNKYVAAAARYIREHYKEDITISTVAGYLEISEGYLSRVFKKETDYTFTSYLACYRMQIAMSLLKDCRVKVYEVADQVGYSDTAYFSVRFKKFSGVSPSEYQERCRG